MCSSQACPIRGEEGVRSLALPASNPEAVAIAILCRSTPQGPGQWMECPRTDSHRVLAAFWGPGWRWGMGTETAWIPSRHGALETLEVTNFHPGPAPQRVGKASVPHPSQEAQQGEDRRLAESGQCRNGYQRDRRESLTLGNPFPGSKHSLCVSTLRRPCLAPVAFCLPSPAAF